MSDNNTITPRISSNDPVDRNVWIDTFIRPMHEKYIENPTINYLINNEEAFKFNIEFTSNNQEIIDSYLTQYPLSGSGLSLEHKPFNSQKELLNFLQENKNNGATNIYFHTRIFKTVDITKLTEQQKQILKDNGNTSKPVEGHEMPLKSIYYYSGITINPAPVKKKRTKKSTA